MYRALLLGILILLAHPAPAEAQAPDLQGLADATADVVVGRQIPAAPMPLDSASAWEQLLMERLAAAEYPEFLDPFLWVKMRHSEISFVDGVAEVTVADSVCTDRGDRGFLASHAYVHSFSREDDAWVYLDTRLRISGSGRCEPQ